MKNDGELFKKDDFQDDLAKKLERLLELSKTKSEAWKKILKGLEKDKNDKSQDDK